MRVLVIMEQLELSVVYVILERIDDSTLETLLDANGGFADPASPERPAKESQKKIYDAFQHPITTEKTFNTNWVGLWGGAVRRFTKETLKGPFDLIFNTSCMSIG